jgi:hypothetical protein
MWARAGAGVLPGFFLAAALIGLLGWLLPGSWESTMVAGLAAFFPLWIGVICAAFRFSSGRRAWLWLGGLALLALGLLWLLQTSGWVR